MDIVTIVCLLAGVFIAGAVEAFKRLTIVAKYPKVVALALAAITAIVSGLTVGELDWASIAECVLVPFSVAVATYEVTKTVRSPVA